MSMKIRTDLTKRLRHIFGLTSTPAQYNLEDNVKPVVDVLKASREHRTIVVPATAGNVTVNIQPEKGHKLTILHGYFTVVTDATVATRNLKTQILTSANTPISMGVKAGDQAASLTRYVGMGILMGDLTDVAATLSAYTGTNVGNLDLSVLGTNQIHEEDQLMIQLTSGVAGDSYSGYIKAIDEKIALEA